MITADEARKIAEATPVAKYAPVVLEYVDESIQNVAGKGGFSCKVDLNAIMDTNQEIYTRVHSRPVLRKALHDEVVKNLESNGYEVSLSGSKLVFCDISWEKILEDYTTAEAFDDVVA